MQFCFLGNLFHRQPRKKKKRGCFINFCGSDTCAAQSGIESDDWPPSGCGLDFCLLNNGGDDDTDDDTDDDSDDE